MIITYYMAITKKNGTQKHLWLDELSTIETSQAAKDSTVIIFPVGSVEEHGEHLPLCTDSVQAEYTALEVAKETGCLVAAPFRYGIVNAGRNFPGTLTIQFHTLYRVVKDVLSELSRNGFHKIIVLSGHAGQSHMVALKLAAQDIVRRDGEENGKQKTRIMVLSDYDFASELASKYASAKDGHAGTIETCRMMAINPKFIKAKGAPSFPEMPRFEVVAHPERCFPSGVIGDPTAASADNGRKINEYVIEQLVKLVKELES